MTVFLFCDRCSWVPCWSWAVQLPAVIQKSAHSLIFQISAYLNPLQKWLYDFEIHLFTWKTIEGLIHNYYIKWKHLLMLKKATQCIKSWGCKLFELNVSTFCDSSIALSVKRWISKLYNHSGKGSYMQKMLENWRMCRSWTIFLKNSRQFDSSGPTIPTQHRKTVVDHPGNNTDY